ncbi:MAG: phage tail tube assembly chaperone [Woeseiaceae bacterium]
MPIFNHKVIQKHIDSITEIPGDDLQIITSWAEQINNGSLAKQTEVAIHSPFTNQIMVKLLGYTPFGESDKWTISREYGVAAGAVDLALGNFSADKSTDVVVAPFELKGAKTKDLDAIMSGRHKTPIQQAWEYAKDIKGAEWVLVSNYVELRLYAVSETSLVYEKFLFQDLVNPSEYAKFKLLLSPENLLGGKTQRILKESLEAEKEISNLLYEDYKFLRESMISHLISHNLDIAPKDLIAPAQKLLDRILFVCFAEDKGLIPDTTIKQAFQHNDPYNPKPIYQNFIGLFNAIDKGNKALDIPAYNGGLFAQDDFLDNLIVNDSLCEGFKDLAEYDFDSEVSVNVLGHIFEQSISDLEEINSAILAGEVLKPQKKSTAVSGKRKKHGVVYTPNNITQFIVVDTLGSHIDEQFEKLFSEYGKYKPDDSIQWKKGKQTELRFWYAWQEKLQQIKVVDPACGSGAFLVAAFDYLYAEYEKTNDQIATLTGQHSVLDLDKEILNNNLFGVDINEESIEITKLSLWLKTAQRGKALESLDANFIAGNSLGFEQSAPDSDFSWKESFKSIFADGGFDVVLGNPPYVRQELLSDIKPWLEQNYTVYHGVLDLYGYFFELGIKLLKPNGRMAYISNATFFKTGSGENLRKYLSSKVTLEKIVDFGDVQVFEGVTTYPAIIVLRNENPTADHKIEILSVENKVPENLQLTFEQDHSLMAQSQLSPDNWRLEDERFYLLRKKLVQGYPTLKDIYGSPYRGVVTGYNDAFVINRKSRDDIVKQDPTSAEIIKPFLEGKDLKPWHVQPRDIFLIFTRRGINIDLYPGIKSYLEQFKERLMPKPKGWSKSAEWSGRKTGPYQWYEIQDTVAYFAEFENPKTIYPEFSDKPNFSFDTTEIYTNNKCFLIPNSDYFLLGLLNSKVLWNQISNICSYVRGNFYELRSIKIETLPIPNKPENQGISTIAETIQSKTESRYQCEQGFSRRLVDLCPDDQTFKLNKKLQSWWLLDFPELQKEIKKAFKGQISIAERNDWQDFHEAEKTKRDNLNNEIKVLEDELNQEVYRLFKLSDDEITLIESAVK